MLIILSQKIYESSNDLIAFGLANLIYFEVLIYFYEEPIGNLTDHLKQIFHGKCSTFRLLLHTQITNTLDEILCCRNVSVF